MDYKEIFRASLKELSMADTLASNIMAVVKDHKVFINILDHLNVALNSAMRAWLMKEYSLKRVRIMPASDALVRQMFFDSYAEPLGVGVSERWIIREMHNVASMHRSEQMEFKRGAEYMLVLPDYKTVTVNENTVKRYLSTAKTIITKIERGLNG